MSILSQNVGASFFPSKSNQKPIDIAKDALDFAKKKVFDILIIDTAGRLAIDEAMMSEISALHHFLNQLKRCLLWML